MTYYDYDLDSNDNTAERARSLMSTLKVVLKDYDDAPTIADEFRSLQAVEYGGATHYAGLYLKVSGTYIAYYSSSDITYYPTTKDGAYINLYDNDTSDHFSAYKYLRFYKCADTFIMCEASSATARGADIFDRVERAFTPITCDGHTMIYMQKDGLLRVKSFDYKDTWSPRSSNSYGILSGYVAGVHYPTDMSQCYINAEPHILASCLKPTYSGTNARGGAQIVEKALADVALIYPGTLTLTASNHYKVNDVEYICVVGAASGGVALCVPVGAKG